MFDYPVGTSAAIVPTTGTSAGTRVAGNLPVTGNFINNAIYAAATYKHHFDFGDACRNCNDFSVGLRAVTAFAHKNPFEIDFGALLGSAALPSIESKGKWYGVECDLLVEAKFYDHLYASFEGGILVPGSAYDIDVTVIDTANLIAPINPDSASLAYAFRFTMMLEF